MALALNKTVLIQRGDQLATFRRFLPSLDLKRQQLIADYQRARRILAATEQEIEERLDSQAGLFALLGANKQDHSDLIKVESVIVREQNVLGVTLPTLGPIRFRRSDYSMLAKPLWVDFLVEFLETMAALQLRRETERRRLARLGEAVRRITQRVNLFEQVLIPQAEKDIQRIKIFLADTERAAVVRAKIAKAKRRDDTQSRGRR